ILCSRLPGPSQLSGVAAGSAAGLGECPFGVALLDVALLDVALLGAAGLAAALPMDLPVCLPVCSAKVMFSVQSFTGWSVSGRVGAVQDTTIGEEGSDAVVEHAQRRADRHVHVQVLVGAESAAEQYLLVDGLLAGQLAV